jgi:hypothetical protein
MAGPWMLKVRSIPDRWLAAVRRWKWQEKPGKPPTFESPEGFVIMFSESGEVHLWGPDKLALEVPERLSKKELKRALLICSYCKRESHPTVRIGFAGRACPPCRAIHLAEVEFPGWNK